MTIEDNAEMTIIQPKTYFLTLHHNGVCGMTLDYKGNMEVSEKEDFIEGERN